ncbi:VrrA/YqfQ family protein [Cytobacillus gottheilii]|uniref:VrrA/YqfQ family protein n=1 Tax=Cytobacillus gottheilii TaxID=859144 RepID=UPI002493DB0C|nr:VrrA/YqfQ family protein [Cytobacillus gottheilii]
MFPGQRGPFQGGMPRSPYMGPMGGQPQMGQMMRAPMRGQGGGGGGLLAKILGGGGNKAGGAAGLLGSRAAGGAGAASGGGFLQTLTNPAAISGFLNNTQKVLHTANQIGPMVQQYGPMVKNLPAMWKLYRGLKDMPDADDTVEETEEKPVKSKQKKTSQNIEFAGEESIEFTPVKKAIKGASSPKLYI